MGRKSHEEQLRPLAAALAIDDDALADLVAGVAAAPESGLSGNRWAKLLGRRPRARVAAALDERAAAAAARYRAAIEIPAPAARLAAVRAELARRRLDGFIVPLGDENHTEFVPLRAQRLAWLTGFSGSAGTAVVLGTRAALFVDGRYTLQAREQVPGALYSFHHLVEEPWRRWLASNLDAGARFGYDPWLHSENEAGALAAACQAAGAELVAVGANPVDAVWVDRPPAPISPAVPHPLRFAGEASAAKRRRLARVLVETEIDAAVLTAPDSLAWLLNLRGADVACTPLALGFAILHADADVDLLIDRRKLSAGLRRHLGRGVRIRERAALGEALDELARAGKTVAIDPATTASWIARRLRAGGAEPRHAADPCALAKAVKNSVELDGVREAHRRDGAALTRFLAWLAREAPRGGLDELAATAKLAAFRADNELIRSASFDTIAGAGPNGAIVHYRATPATNRRLERGQLFLLDSGAQYLDGTTDVTRTIAIGTPNDEMRDRFTRVLKGHIAIATCRFPDGTTGSQIDTLARQFLWQAGLDYDHGTGHGVGSYLGVHEGPQRISKLPNAVALKPGMIVSNEPGYYEADAYGIRIENLVAVMRDEGSGGEGAGARPFHRFETLTLAPIDRNLIDAGLLTAAEIGWVDRYHARVRDTLAVRVDAATRAWLEEATAPLLPATGAG